MEKSPEFSAQLVQILQQERQKTSEIQRQMEAMTIKVDCFDRLVETNTSKFRKIIVRKHLF